MTETALPLKDFLKLPGVIFDVRSPAEFEQGHFPGAFNLPLMSNEERVVIGTAYKQQGKQPAIMLGLKLAGPKLADFVTQARLMSEGKTAKVHCWRGGMRSQFMSWLLNFSGLPSVTLTGGYKVFRRWCLEQFALPLNLFVIGGMTGSGKTDVLKALESLGEQVIDLEGLASHRGSSFGRIGMQAPQPSTEQFENEIAMRLSAFDISRPIWIEDESRLIGTCHLPQGLFNRMLSGPLIVVEPPHQERLDRLVAEYGQASPVLLAAATKRISKHLGGQRTKDVLTAIDAGQIVEAFTTLLQYYDAAYSHCLTRRTPALACISGEHLSILERAEELRQIAYQLESPIKAVI